MVMRKEEKQDVPNISLEDLASLVEKEREIYQANLEKAEDIKDVKDDIFKFFNHFISLFLIRIILINSF